MIEFIICDDNDIMRDNVKRLIDYTMNKSSNEYSVSLYDDYNRNFKEFIGRNKRQVIYILDVDMPSESGIDMARAIRNTDKSSVIIFLTSHSELSDMIIKSRLNVLTFISKYDNCKENLVLAIKEALEYFPSNDVVLDFCDSSNIYHIYAKDVLYITKDVRKTVIKTDHDRLEVYVSLEKLKPLLPDYFKQSHRACIINLKRVEAIDYDARVIYFDNGDTVDLIGAKYKKELVFK